MLSLIFRKAASLAVKSSVPGRLWKDQAYWLTVARSLASTERASVADDPVERLSTALRSDTLSHFAAKYIGRTSVRVLLHIPDRTTSMGGHSLFTNWIDGMRHLGIACCGAATGTPLRASIEEFKPTVIFTSDHPLYTNGIDWQWLREYRQEVPLILGLTASIGDQNEAKPDQRLSIARDRGVNFYVSFREPEYIEQRLSAWLSHGFPVLSLPFAANPLWQWRCPVGQQPLDFSFFGSINPEKATRYLRYLTPIMRNHRGVLNGPGWGHDDLMLARELQPWVYALSKVCLNLHIPISIAEYNEVNERTFILGCCGAFQVSDAPRAMRRFFPSNAVPVAHTAREYKQTFEHFKNHPEDRTDYQLNSLRAVYDGHTIFHRMSRFVEFVDELLCN